MAGISTKNGQFTITLSIDEFNSLGFNPSGRYEFVKVKDGLWVLLEKEAGQEKAAEVGGTEKPKLEEDEARILKLLSQKSLSERVEGKFEKYLNDRELRKFREMVEAGMVEKFKLSPSYKKAVYKIVRNTTEKDIDEFSLEKDGFLVVRNQQRARRLQDELGERIKQKEIRGIKSFAGDFYIIENTLYEKHLPKMTKAFREKKKATIGELSSKVGIPPTLTKILCEFMREDGELIERKKELYEYVE